MTFVALLRMKRILIRFAAIAFAIVAISQIADVWTHQPQAVVQIDGTDKDVPFSFFICVASFFAAIGSTIFGTSLQQQRRHRAITWTLPMSRTRTAGILIGVDLIGLLASYTLALAVIVGPAFADMRSGTVISDGAEMPALAFGFVYVLLWYALIEAATVWFPQRAGTITGVSWPVFLFAAGITYAKIVPVPIRILLDAFNVINPVAYLIGLFDKHAAKEVALLPWPVIYTSTVAMLVVALIALVVSVAGWRRAAA